MSSHPGAWPWPWRMLSRVENRTGHHRHHHRGSDPARARPPLRAVPGRGGADRRAAHPPGRRRPRRRPGDHRLAPAPPPRPPGLPRHDQPLPHPGRAQRLRAAAARLARGAEELPARSPHHLREARDPARPARPPGPVPHRVQPAPTPPITAAPGHPGHGLRRDAQRPARAQPRHRHRVRHDRIGSTGTVTLRVAGALRHIGIGRTHTGTHVILLIQDHQVRVVNATTGELLRELTIDPTRDYQPRA